MTRPLLEVADIARVALARKLPGHLYWMLRPGWNCEQMVTMWFSTRRRRASATGKE
jgi:hypothetical protein